MAAFSLANFVQAFFVVGLDPALNPAAYPLEFFTGGVAQLIAGIFEFRQGSRLGGTTFSLYGSFWIGFVVYNHFVIDTLPPGDAHTGSGLFLLPWAVLTILLTLAAVRTSGVLLATFVSSTLVFCLEAAGEFARSSQLLKVGGAFGFVTAAVGLYATVAGLVNGTWGRRVLPTYPDPGKRLARLAHERGRPVSVTSSAGEAELAGEAAR
jgi:succinate-acetate transporter protein